MDNAPLAGHQLRFGPEQYLSKCEKTLTFGLSLGRGGGGGGDGGGGGGEALYCIEFERLLCAKVFARFRRRYRSTGGGGF